MDNGSLAVVLNEKRDQVLVIKRRDVAIWVLPGGGINPGETPEDAIVREVLEETGIKAEIVREVGIYTPINKLTVQTHLFECKPIEGSPTIGSETSDVKFVSLNNLPSPFFYIHKELIEDALSSEDKPRYRPFSNVTYWALLKYLLRHPVEVIRYSLSRLGFPINS